MATAPIHNPKCFANHMGFWAIESKYFNNALAAIKSGALKPRAEPAAYKDDEDFKPRDPLEDYLQIQDGVAVVSLCGVMAKGFSKYAECNTQLVRRAMRLAAEKPEVSMILLCVDSPGGMVAGTEELAADIKAAAAKKPVWAQIEDCCASAALWCASQATKVFANATATIGSIGVITVLEDSSKAAEMQGVKVHVISTGEMKGAGAPGTVVTPEMISSIQARIDSLGEFFVNAIADGRAMDKKEARKLATGEVWLAAEAKKLGLIDAVQSMDTTFAQISMKSKPKARIKATFEMQLRS